MSAPSAPPVESRLIRLPSLLPCLVALAGAALAPAVAAEARLGRPYAEVQLGASGVRHSGLDFVSPFAGASAGLWLYPGIGVEAFAETELERGADAGFEAGVAEAYGAALRLSSPARDGLRGYVVLGYVDFTVAQAPRDGAGREIEERFGGARVGIGLQQRLRVAPALLVGAEYRSFLVDEPIHVEGLVLGLRIDVR